MKKSFFRLRPSSHQEWLSMIEVSGSFLAVSVLEKIFPQGLESLETYRKKRIRSAYEEWRDAVEEDDPQLPELHRAWIGLVLEELLEYEDSILEAASDKFIYKSPDGDGQFKPDFVLKGDGENNPMLFVSIMPEGTDLEKVKVGDGWPVPVFERMTLLCRDKRVRLGVVTNGERWMLVNAPVGSTSSHVSWYARLWFQEPVTLKAFQSLLGVRRWFGPEEETLPAMLEDSLQHHEEVTDTLGEQVKRAVEMLVQCLDKADQDRNRELLHDVPPAELYEAGLTVMMRLVFVLCAEERGLLLLGDSIYDQYYAISTLRGQLAEEADQHGHEVLERRHDAWTRLLAVFRAVYGGIEHESLRMPALGGSLFDPDRFPFLEGRAKGTHWQETPAQPLPIDNRTVLLLLEALQVLEQRGGALLLSYKALDVEQIGHVYEGLLEHTVRRLKKDTLGLIGSQKAKNPNLTLAELESARLDGDEAVTSIVETSTQRSRSAISNALAKEVDDATFGKIVTVCGGDMELAARLKPFAHLLRTDAWGDFIVYHAHSFAVTLGADRRETGTHYTPKSLTESIVKTTLEPVAYVGPAEGNPREEWTLKSSAELLELKICDPAMGSGAFLVQVCRWLSERLVEAWGKEAGQGKFISVDGVALESAGSAEPMPDSLDERLLIARRLVAEKCLYGVDLNPLAVELAKLSIWLITLAKGRPFGFLDHNLRSGDSLLGLHKLEQLYCFDLHADNKTPKKLFAQKIEEQIKEALALRKQLREIPIRDIRDVQYMERLDQEARQKLEHIEHIADAMIGEALASGGNQQALDNAMDNLSTWAVAYIEGNNETGRKIIAEARKSLSIDLPAGKPPRKPFHWALEFPEVFENNGFDAVVGNPPFLGNRLWRSAMGERFQWQCQLVVGSALGKIDLCVVFHRRVAELLKTSSTYGLLATSNISEGSAIAVGLSEIVKNGDIYFSRKGMAWPGKAAVIVAVVCFYKSKWSGCRDSDGQNCDRIGSRLEPESANIWNPVKLGNAPFAFEGVNNSKGLAFLVSPSDEWFETLKMEPNSLLRPYITGDDITSSALNTVKRWALDIEGRDISEITSKWPKASHFLHEVVKPTRTPEALKSYKGLIDRWWQFPRHRSDLMSRLRLNKQFVAYSKNTKFPFGILAPSEWIYTNKVLLIGKERDDLFAITLSTGFRGWLEAFCGGNLGVTLTLSISESVDKFPLPIHSVSPKGIKASVNFDEQVKTYSKLNSCGLTETINSINSPKCTDPEIINLRTLLETIDREVAIAYEWDGLEIEYNFQELPDSNELDKWRWSVTDGTADRVKNLLLDLNRKRYEEEVVQGLHDTKKKKTSTPRKKKTSPAKDDGNMDLFNFMNASSKGPK